MEEDNSHIFPQTLRSYLRNELSEEEQKKKNNCGGG